MVLECFTCFNITIIDTIHLRRRERNRDGRLDENVMSFELSVDTTSKVSDDSRELENIGLLRDIASSSRESCRLCIPDTNFHSSLVNVHKISKDTLTNIFFCVTVCVSVCN